MKKILILSVAVAAMLFTACGPKEEEIVNSSALQGIKLAPSSVTLEEGESVKLHVKYTPDSAKATAPKVLWYSDKQRVASVNEEGLVTADRPGTAVITATCGKFKATCTVNVSKKDLPGPDPSVSFSVSPKNIEAPAEGGTYEIVVKSNAEWTAELENPEWASLNTTSGCGDATLTLTVEGTEDETPISQNITFTAGKGKYFVLVSRAGYKKVAQLKLDKTEADVAVSGGSVTVNVESEAEWTVTCDDPHVSVSKSGNSATITVEKFNLSEGNFKELYGMSATGNYFYIHKDERGLPIPVLFSNGDNSVTCMVYQKYPYIGVSIYGSDKEGWTYWNKAEAHDFTLQIEANIPWTIEFSWDNNQYNWATVNQSSGSGNATVTLHFKENTSGSTQSGLCMVNSAGGYTPFMAAYLQGEPNIFHGWQ